MPSNSVQINNCNCGDNICSPFGLQIEYTLVGQQCGYIVVNDTNGASIQTSPMSVMPTNGTPTTVTVTLTYSSSSTGESISVALTDANQNVLASDSVGNITVTQNAPNQPLQITQPPGNAPGAPAPVPVHQLLLRTGSVLSGIFLEPPGPTYNVFLYVESRVKGSRRRKIEFMDAAVVVQPVAVGAPAVPQGTWTYDHAPGGGAKTGIPAAACPAGKECCLRLVLTANGIVIANARAPISST